MPECVRHYLKLSQQLISCFCHFLNNSTTLVLLELKKTSYFLMKCQNEAKLDLDCNNVKPRLDNENGWISMRNDF